MQRESYEWEPFLQAKCVLCKKQIYVNRMYIC